MQVISETDEEIVLEWDYTLETYNHIFAIKRTIDTKVAGVHIELCCENTKLSNVKPDTFHHQMSLLPIKFDPRLLEYTRPTHPSYQSRYPTEQELTEIGESGRPTYKNTVPYRLPLSTEEQGPDYFPFEKFPFSEHQVVWFKLDVHCSFNETTQKLEHDIVSGDDFIWVPFGTQQERFGPQNIPKVNVSFVMKLLENQRLCYFFAVMKGYGSEYIGFKGAHTTLNYNDDGSLDETICPKDKIRLIIRSVNGLHPWYFYTESLNELKCTFRGLRSED